MKVSDIEVKVTGWSAVMFLAFMLGLYISLIPLTLANFYAGNYIIAALGLFGIFYLPYSVYKGSSLNNLKS